MNSTTRTNGKGITGGAVLLRRRGLAATALATLAVTALALAADAAVVAAAAADSNNGPYCWDAQVAANSSKAYRMTFRGGETATVEASGDGDIDIVVRDARGRVVDRDELSDHEPACEWVPAYTQVYTVTVVNCEGYTVDFHGDTN